MVYKYRGVYIPAEKFPELFMVTFKYTLGKSREELLSIAKSRVEKGSQIVVANRGEEMAATHKAYIVGESRGVTYNPRSKTEIANRLLDAIVEEMNPKDSVSLFYPSW